jgi:hypothetical protein
MREAAIKVSAGRFSGCFTREAHVMASLSEILTGPPPHRRDPSQETMASILRDEPDLHKVPARAHRLLKRCLEKDAQKRLRHIGDVMSLLHEPHSGRFSSSIPASTARELRDEMTIRTPVARRRGRRVDPRRRGARTLGTVAERDRVGAVRGIAPE